MFLALSLGVPRRVDMLAIKDSPIDWNGLEFMTRVASKRDRGDAIIETRPLTGRALLGSNGLPAALKYPSAGDFPGASVSYEYRPEMRGIPTAFVVKLSDVEFRYEFLLLTLGSNYLGETEGYVPVTFAPTNLNRHFTIWTNALPYSIINGKSVPAFGVKKPRNWLPLILISASAVCVTFLLVRYRR